jgi:hypothetical protein
MRRWNLGPATSAPDWTAVGADTLHEALSDGSDSSYAQSGTLSESTATTWTAPILDRIRQRPVWLRPGPQSFTVRAKYIDGNARVRIVCIADNGSVTREVGTSQWYTLGSSFQDVIIDVATSDACNYTRVEVTAFPDGWIGLDSEAIGLDQELIGLN